MPSPSTSSHGCGCGRASRTRRRPRSTPAARPRPRAGEHHVPFHPDLRASFSRVARFGPPPTISSAASGTDAGSPAAPGSACPDPCAAPAGTRRRPLAGRSARAGPGPVRPQSGCRCPRARRQRRTRSPVQHAGQPAAGVLAEVGQHVDAPPMRGSAGRAAGPAAQPTSWPWVPPPPGGRRPAAADRASSPSGAAAPNHTVSHRTREPPPALRRSTGSAAAPGWLPDDLERWWRRTSRHPPARRVHDHRPAG